jgi:hypothetical protein
MLIYNSITIGIIDIIIWIIIDINHINNRNLPGVCPIEHFMIDNIKWKIIDIIIWIIL